MVDITLFRSLSKFVYVGDIFNFERADLLQISSRYRRLNQI
jgi:hypothetical protein